MMQIHVTEEARHMRFAERYLIEHMPQLAWPLRAMVRTYAPLILRENARLMLEPGPALVRRFEIPRGVLREAYGLGTVHSARVATITEGVMALLREQPGSALAIDTASPST